MSNDPFHIPNIGCVYRDGGGEGGGGNKMQNFHFCKYFTSMRTHKCLSDS